MSLEIRRLLLLSLFITLVASCTGIQEPKLDERPTVVYISPASDEEPVPIGVEFEIRFSVPMAALATESCIRLRGSSGEAIPLDTHWMDEDRLLICPETFLLPEAEYDLEIGEEACSADGLHLVEPWDLRFSTRNCEWILLKEWALGTNGAPTSSLEYIADLADSLDQFFLESEPCPESAFRLGWSGPEVEGAENLEWVRNRSHNSAGYMANLALRPIPSWGFDLMTHRGCSPESLEVELAGSKSWIEALTGRPCEVLAYPYHAHSRSTMLSLARNDYIAGRSQPKGVEPWGSFLLGPPDDPRWLNSWDQLSIYEMPWTFYGEIQDLAVDELDTWLHDPDHLPLWKDHHHWIHFYTHTDDPSETSTPILDGDHLATLLDLMLDDGDIWIAPIGEIAHWAWETHEVSEDSLILVPRPDWQGDPARPWRGRACACSFSTDDGMKANLRTFGPIFYERNLSYTAHIVPSFVSMGDEGHPSYMSSAEVLDLMDLDIEIGSHTISHKPCIGNRALRLSNPYELPMALSITSQSGAKRLSLYRYM